MTEKKQGIIPRFFWYPIRIIINYDIAKKAFETFNKHDSI